LLEGYEGQKLREAKIPKTDRAEIPEGIERLIDFYDQTGQANEAAKWRKTRDTSKTNDGEKKRPESSS
jgi:hypothetical protein